VQWQLPLDREASGEFVLIGPTVLVQAGSNEVAGVDLAGRLLWRKPLGRLRGLPAGRHQLGVLAFADLPRLVALDLPTGAELWRAETEAVTGPVVEGGTLFLGVTNGICACHLTDGHLLWLTPLATPAQPLSLSGGVLATVTSSNELVMLDARSGRIQSRIPGALATQPPVLVRDEVLYAVPGALMVAAAADPDPKRWMATGWLGDLSAPPVLSDSAVYFATAERGFIKAGRAR
jgi:outer membrane protein assembly factor BamB